MRLAGVVAIRGDARRLRRAIRREIGRAGLIGFADVAAMRLYARLGLAARDRAWARRRVEELRRAYPADLAGVARVAVSDPNSEAAREFLGAVRPDLIVARCKFILRPAIFELARAGAFALHPGICPEYRNAHGCFWALVNRDLERVGMTLLRLDRGVDTGPIYLHAAADFDELRDSHVIIQHRVVFDNLDAIGRVLIAVARGQAPAPVSTAGRRSAAWGQPGLSHYLRWKWAARRGRRQTA
jgi:methionyl-tRNA formyltransferase